MKRCAVRECSNDPKDIGKWKLRFCYLHQMQHQFCSCFPPFAVFTFPTEREDPVGRKRWIYLINKKSRGGKSAWSPAGCDRVCSKHFVNGEPTPKNPDPTLHLGYDATKRLEKLHKCGKKASGWNSDEEETVVQPVSVANSAKKSSKGPVGNHDYVCISSATPTCITNGPNLCSVKSKSYLPASKPNHKIIPGSTRPPTLLVPMTFATPSVVLNTKNSSPLLTTAFPVSSTSNEQNPPLSVSFSTTTSNSPSVCRPVYNTLSTNSGFNGTNLISVCKPVLFIPNTLESGKNTKISSVDKPTLKVINQSANQSRARSAPIDLSVQQSYHDSLPCSGTPNCNCSFCVAKLRKKVKYLEENINILKRHVTLLKRKRSVTDKLTRSDEITRRFTGIQSKNAFDQFFKFLEPHALKLKYHRKKRKSADNFTRNKRGPNRILSIKEEFMLVLIKVKMGMTNDVLSEWFGISYPLCDLVLQTWLPFLVEFVKPLIDWPEKKEMIKILPKRLHQQYEIMQCAEKCTEIFYFITVLNSEGTQILSQEEDGDESSDTSDGEKSVHVAFGKLYQALGVTSAQC